MDWTCIEHLVLSGYIISLSEKPYKVLIYCHPNHVQILAYCLPSILLPSGKTYQAGFKLNIQKAKIMAPGPITSWQWKQWQTLFWGGSKITADGDCSHEIERRLPPGGKAMTNLDSKLKNRDITLQTKVRLVKAMVFPVVMYGCESWTIKKAECLRIDAFELWCWRRLLRDPWTARRSNQFILKQISPGYSLEGLMVKLKLQYFGRLMRRADSYASRDWR